MRRLLLAVTGLASVAGAVLASHASAAPAPPASNVVLDGSARFEVLTPTLIRLEYATDGHFEDRPTQNALHRNQKVPPFSVTRAVGSLTITTGKVTLTYLEAGPFTPADVQVTLADGRTVRPTWDPCQQVPASCAATFGLPGTADQDPTVIGGWSREVIDVQGVRPPQHGGLLSTTGAYLLDDTSTAIQPTPTTFEARQSHVGAYQDGYLFAYGSDYPQGLDDLNQLVGAAPLLPRWLFGPWFSAYAPYSAADYETTILPAFRAHDTPVDGLSVDTDFRAPDHWNGWSWNAQRFPDPQAFLDWTKAQGLHVVLNTHPSIDSTDPRFAAAQADAGGALKTSQGDCQFYRSDPPCYVFDWSDPAQAKAYFDLGAPFEAQGISGWWLDWCCDASTVSAAGLTPDGFINNLYAERARSQGQRGFVLSRVGSGIVDSNAELGDLDVPATGPWSDRRSTIQFTGDATSDFATLAFEARQIPGTSAATGLPYISDDIGGYTGDKLADDLYTRWIQLGALSPIFRPHSDHGQRLPWQYGAAAESATERMFRLREELVPYLYDSAWQAHTDGAPLARMMVLGWPTSSAALAAKDQWMLGDSLLVAPITTAGTSATRSVWLPPGQWTDFFTGATTSGDRSVSVTDGLDRLPLWVKAGGIVPMGPPASNVEAGHEGLLTLRVAPGAAGSTTVHDDSGEGLAYEQGAATQTAVAYDEPVAGSGRVTISPRTGTFPGAPARRPYDVAFLATSRPAVVTVDGVAVPASADRAPQDLTTTSGTAATRDGWTYDPATRTVTVHVASRAVSARTVVAHDLPATSPAGRGTGRSVRPARVTAPKGSLAATGLWEGAPVVALVLLGLGGLLRRRRATSGRDVL